MLDPDEAGSKATREIVDRLVSQLYIRVIDLTPEGLEPDELSTEWIRQIVGG